MADASTPDRPLGVSPVVAKFLRHWSFNPDYAKVPARVMQRVATTRAGDGVERRRRWMALDWYCRTCAATWLTAVGRRTQATLLKGFGPIRGKASSWDAYMVLEGAEGPMEEAASLSLPEWWWAELEEELGAGAWDDEVGDAVVNGMEAAVDEALVASGMEAAWEAAAAAEPLDLAKNVSSDAARVIVGDALVAAGAADLAQAVAARLAEDGIAGRLVEAVLEIVVEEYARAALEGVVEDLRRSSLALLNRMIAAGAE